MKTFDEYQGAAERTANDSLCHRDQLANAAMGVMDEGGEVGGLIKKHLFKGHDLDLEDLRSEIGDVLWYIASLCSVTGLTMEECASANIAKLKARHPDGFTVASSKAKADEALGYHHQVPSIVPEHVPPLMADNPDHPLTKLQAKVATRSATPDDLFLPHTNPSTE